MTELLALALAGALAGATAEPAPRQASEPTSPAAARAAARDDADARRHFEAGHFAEAAALYARAHAQDPRPIYLYRWAQAERRAGNCPVAAQLYRRYLAHDVGPENEAAARKNLARCGYTDEPVDTLEPVAPEPDTPATPPPSATQIDRRAWLKDPWALTLVGLGASGVLAAAILGGVSGAEIDRANESTVEDDYVRHADRADSMRIAAIATGTVGAALIVGGVTRWLLVRRRDRRAAAQTSALGLTIRF